VSVSLSVSLSVTRLRYAEYEEQIQVLFGVELLATKGAVIKIMRVHIPHGDGEKSGANCIHCKTLPAFNAAFANGCITQSHTDKIPLAARLVDGIINALEWPHRQIQLRPVIGPRSKLHLASLVVKRKPANVNGARRYEDSQWSPVTSAI